MSNNPVTQAAMRLYDAEWGATLNVEDEVALIKNQGRAYVGKVTKATPATLWVEWRSVPDEDVTSRFTDTFRRRNGQHTSTEEFLRLDIRPLTEELRAAAQAYWKQLERNE